MDSVLLSHWAAWVGQATACSPRPSGNAHAQADLGLAPALAPSPAPSASCCFWGGGGRGSECSAQALQRTSPLEGGLCAQHGHRGHLVQGSSEAGVQGLGLMGLHSPVLGLRPSAASGRVWWGAAGCRGPSVGGDLRWSHSHLPSKTGRPLALQPSLAWRLTHTCGPCVHAGRSAGSAFPAHPGPSPSHLSLPSGLTHPGCDTLHLPTWPLLSHPQWGPEQLWPGMARRGAGFGSTCWPGRTAPALHLGVPGHSPEAEGVAPGQ